MALVLSTTTGSGPDAVDITSEIALGTDYTADQDRLVHVSFRLRGLTATAANLTAVVRHKAADGTTLREFFYDSPRAKRTATDTTYGDAFAFIPILSGEKLEFRVKSSNSSDTVVAYQRSIFDAGSNVWALPAVAAGATNGLPLQTSAGGVKAVDLSSAALATAASQTTLLNRIGAFTGSGVNTILGFLKAALSKSATLPTDVGGTFDPSTDSTEAIRDNAASSSSSTSNGIVDTFR